LRIRSLEGYIIGTFESRFRKRQVAGYPEARSSGLRRAGQGDTKHRRRTFRPIHGLGQPVSYCRDNSDPALARLLGALLHVSGSIDDLQVRDAPEGQQCRPRSIAIGWRACYFPISVSAGGGSSSPHCHARNSYSNCGSGERDLVHSLTPEAMATSSKSSIPSCEATGGPGFEPGLTELESPSAPNAPKYQSGCADGSGSTRLKRVRSATGRL
jgi:hypothetical protein